MLLTPANVPAHMKDFVEPQNRPAIDRATRDELIAYAKNNGVPLDENMPIALIKQILRNKGLTNIKAGVRVMGEIVGYRGDGGAMSQNTIATVDAVSDLQKQWEQKQAAGKNKVSGEQMSMNELRHEAKRRGIKLTRSDTRQSIQEKLSNG